MKACEIAPTQTPDCAEQRRCCWQDSWEDTLAQTPVGFRFFATQLVHVLRHQVYPRCLQGIVAPGQRSRAPSLCNLVPLGPLRVGLGTHACFLAPALAVQLSLLGQRAQMHIKLKCFSQSCSCVWRCCSIWKRLSVSMN